MTLEEFITLNEEEIDNVIMAECGSDYDIDDHDREHWVSNNPYLYEMAISMDVDV